jgi:hypothetical protein
MSWNAALYYYHLSRGGDYFGLPQKAGESSAHAALVLPREKGPIHISPWLDNYGRYGVSWKVAVTCQVELQAPYTLKITGGGAVLRAQNVRALRQNGVVVYIDRPLGQLAVGGARPLSQSAEALAAMHAARAPLYAAACDARVENDGPFESVAEAIKERFYEILDH